MSPARWSKLSEETRFENPWWIYKRDRVILPSGNEGEYHYVDTPGSVMIVPVTSAGMLVMVRQYRYLNNRSSLEFPGGGIPRGHAPADAAARELQEEAGVEAAVLREVGVFNPFNGVTNELCHVFVATGHRAVAAHPEETEDCETALLSPAELRALIAAGEIWDGMTLAALAMVALTAPDLLGIAP
jgi:ADP-ribose pyrophosphatase